MIVRKAYKFKLKPTKEQEALFERYAGASRWVWNRMLAESNAQYEATGKRPTYCQQSKRLTEIKYQEGTEWLQAIHAQALREPIRHLHTAWGRFFEGISERPRFKSKHRDPLRFTYPQHIKVDGNQVWLPKIGWVRFRKSREVEGTIKGATVRRQASGWYVAIRVALEVVDPVLPPLDATQIRGLDMGLKVFATPDIGDAIPNPRPLQKTEKKLVKAQRKLARMQRGSKRYHKQKQKIALLHEEVANQRREFHHQLSHRLTAENQGVIVEDLSMKGLARTRLAKSIYDVGWGEFVRQLAYKSAWRGVYFCKIDRFYPSTRLHRTCGTLNTVTLKDRHFVCQGCGEEIDRDRNAAENIKARGLELLAKGS